MRSFVKRVVFQPPRDPACLQNVLLQKQRRHVHYATKANGERVSYLHVRLRGKPHYTTPHGAPLVILYHHGNGENLGLCAEVARQLAAVLHIDVVVYDYCGYGFSGYAAPAATTATQDSHHHHDDGNNGEAAAATTARNTKQTTTTTPKTSLGERSVYMDAECMYEELMRLGYAPCQVVLMGRSLGGGPACYLAARHQHEIAGLVLQSTFTSCLEVVSRHVLPRCLPWCNMFHNDRHIRAVLRCPILLLHGTDDAVVPFRCSQSLLAIAVKARQRECARAQRLRDKQQRRQPQQQQQQPRNDSDAASLHASRVDNTVSGGMWCTGRTRTRTHATSASASASATAMTSVELVTRSGLRTSSSGNNNNNNSSNSDGDKRLHDAQALGISYAWLSGCGHNNMEERAFDAYFAELRHFLDKVVRYVATTLHETTTTTTAAASATAAAAV